MERYTVRQNLDAGRSAAHNKCPLDLIYIKDFQTGRFIMKMSKRA